jgi:hypothetical protein
MKTWCYVHGERWGIDKGRKEKGTQREKERSWSERDCDGGRLIREREREIGEKEIVGRPAKSKESGRHRERIERDRGKGRERARESKGGNIIIFL